MPRVDRINDLIVGGLPGGSAPPPSGLPNPPSAPVVTTVTQISAQVLRVDITSSQVNSFAWGWLPWTHEVAGYMWERAVNSSGPWRRFAKTFPSHPYVYDYELQPDTEYFYRAYAIGNYNEDPITVTSATTSMMWAPSSLSNSMLGRTAAVGTVVDQFYAINPHNKIWKHQRPVTAGSMTNNSRWDGTRFKVKGAPNEVVDIGFVAESNSGCNGLTVEVSTLTGPGGNVLRPGSSTLADASNYVNREIEVFVMHYVMIEGCSALNLSYYASIGEGAPKMMRTTSTTWLSRPGADKFVPEWCVPAQWWGEASVDRGSSRTWWADIYLPSTYPSGVYTGTVSLKRLGTVVSTRGIDVTVRSMAALPNSHYVRSTIYHQYNMPVWFTGNDTYDQFVSGGRALSQRFRQYIEKGVRRHHLNTYAMGEENSDVFYGGTLGSFGVGSMQAVALNGTLYTQSFGYEGPGYNTPHDTYWLGFYGRWMQFNANANPGSGTLSAAANSAVLTSWMNSMGAFMNSNYPQVKNRYWYIVDEPADTTAQNNQVNAWLDAWSACNSDGKSFKPFLTVNYPHGVEDFPRAKALCAWIGYAGVSVDATSYFPEVWTVSTSYWNAAINSHLSVSGNEIQAYNGLRPGQGAFAPECEGTDPMVNPWIVVRNGMTNWYYWAGDYYRDDQVEGSASPMARNVPWNDPVTFGSYGATDATYGYSGNRRTHYDGVLWIPSSSFSYPGATPFDPTSKEGVVFGARMKNWRRGSQDMEYYARAAVSCLTTANSVVASVVSRAMWNVPTTSNDDPTSTNLPQSWPEDAEAFLSAVDSLANVFGAS